MQNISKSSAMHLVGVQEEKFKKQKEKNQINNKNTEEQQQNFPQIKKVLSQ